MALSMALSRIDDDMDKKQIVPVSSATRVDIKDWLFRLQQSGSVIACTITPTENIRRPIRHVVHENGLFREVIKNLWQVYKYQQEYQSFLLGGCSEAEFLAVAEKYATSFQHMDAEALTWASSVLINVLDNYLTSSDLSVLLNVDPAEIENTLVSSSNIHAFPLEHRETHGE